MRILFLCEGYRPGTDACAKRMSVFADHLRSKGHEVTVLASSTNLSEGGNPEEGVLYCRTAPMRRKTPFRRLVNNVSFPLAAVRRAREVGSVDVVVVTSPPLLAAPAGRRIARSKGAKLVFDLRDVWPEVAYEMGSFSEGSAYGRAFSCVARSMYREADLVTTVTPGKAEKLSALFLREGIDPCKIRVVENGLDESFLELSEDEKFLRRFEFIRGFTCVYAGNLGLAQGLSQLLDLASWALSSYPDARFLLLGSGAEEDVLRKRVAGEGLSNVEFCGTVGPRQVYTALRHAKMCFVSLKNAEMTSSVPTKLYESLGVGCPTLLVACGDACGVLEETRLGACARPGDSVSIRGAYVSMREGYEGITHKKRRAQDAIAARHLRQRHAEAFEVLLGGLVNEGKVEN